MNKIVRISIFFFVYLLKSDLFLFALTNIDYRLNPQGILERKKNSRWIETKGKGLPTRWLYPFASQEKRPLTSYSFSLSRPLELIVTTSDQILVSHDGGESFNLVATKETLSRSSYFTSSVLSNEDPQQWVIGTSFNGLHITKDGGKTWKNIQKGFKSLSYGGSYYDTINDMSYSLADANKVYFACGPYGKIGLLNLQTEKIENLTEVPEKQGVRSLFVDIDRDRERLFASTDLKLWMLESNEWKLVKNYGKSFLSGAQKNRQQKMNNRKGIYLTAWTANDLKAFERHLKFVKQKGMNSIVIDFKDDLGFVRWDSQVEQAKEAQAVRPILDVEAILKKAKEEEVSIIARFVVFKDKNLYKYQNYKFALWNKRKQIPWANFVEDDLGQLIQKEYWVDIFSENVWNYNIALAQELEKLGVDEIQFDYIRFPSDGPVSQASSRHNTKAMRNVDALESFLKKAREKLSLPISVDVYGYNGWFLTDSLGQNIDRLSLYVDAISPMTYPSHYPEAFLGNLSYMERARMLYEEGMSRTKFYTKNRILVREYVQAFLLGGERKFSQKIYQEYLNKQLQGIYNAGGNSFLLWNSSNNYYMLE